MPSVTSEAGPIHLGMGTSKSTIVVGILLPGEEVPVLDRVWNEEDSVRHWPAAWGRRGSCGRVTKPGRAGPGCTGC
jgi:hypothetical protein